LFLELKNYINAKSQKEDVLKSQRENVHFKKKDSAKEEYVAIKQKGMEESYQINVEDYGDIVQEYLKQLAKIWNQKKVAQEENVVGIDLVFIKIVLEESNHLVESENFAKKIIHQLKEEQDMKLYQITVSKKLHALLNMKIKKKISYLQYIKYSL